MLLPPMRKSIALFEGTQTLSACPSESNYIQMTTSLDVTGKDNRKVKVKVKGTLVQALRLCIGRTAHRGNRGIALPFYDHGTRSG